MARLGWGLQKETGINVLADQADRKTVFAFNGYGYLRVHANGDVTARGDWVSFSIPRARGPVTLNGKPVKAQLEGDYLVMAFRRSRRIQHFRRHPPPLLPLRTHPRSFACSHVTSGR